MVVRLYIYMCVYICILYVRLRSCVAGRRRSRLFPLRRLPSHEARTPLEITDFMGHLRRLMKELYEAGFLF